MKCPQCNYVSFDSVPRCKKCGFQFRTARAQQESVDVRSLVSEGNIRARESGHDGQSSHLKKTVSSIRKSLDEIEGQQGDGEEQRFEQQSLVVDTDELTFRVDNGYMDTTKQFPDHSEINWEESVSLSNHDLVLPLHDDEGEAMEVPRAAQGADESYTGNERFRQELHQIGEQLKEIDELPTPSRPDAKGSRSAENAVRSARKGGFWIRAVAYSLDTVILSLLSIVLTVVGIIALGIASPNLGDLNEERILGLVLPLYLFNTIITIFYYTYFHGSVGQTPGKMLCGLKVVSVNGEPPGYARAFLRWVGYFLSGVFFCLGFLWAAWDRQKQSWHDKIAGTYVLKL